MTGIHCCVLAGIRTALATLIEQLFSRRGVKIATACVVSSSVSTIDEIEGSRTSGLARRRIVFERTGVRRSESGLMRCTKRFRYEVPSRIVVVSFLRTPNQTSVNKSPMVTRKGTNRWTLNPLALAPWEDGRFGGVETKEKHPGRSRISSMRFGLASVSTVMTLVSWI